MPKTLLGKIILPIVLQLVTFCANAADLIDTAASATSFKTFLAAVKTAGITETLKNTGPYTVFIPSDQAFAKLPDGAWAALSKDKARLTKLVNYHIIRGKILITDIKPGPANTIQGDTVKLTSDNGMVTINGAHVTQSDISADNGVLHEIDTILIPE